MHIAPRFHGGDAAPGRWDRRPGPQAPPVIHTIEIGGEVITHEELKRRVRYIKSVMTKVPSNVILQVLKECDFHVKKTLEVLVDSMTRQAAALPESRRLVAQSTVILQHSQALAASHGKSYYTTTFQAPGAVQIQGTPGDLRLAQAGDGNQRLRPVQQMLAAVGASPDVLGGPIPHESPAMNMGGPPASPMEMFGVGRRKALLIGINYFGTRKELNGCVDDVYRMKNLITSVFGFMDNPLCLTLLTDRPGYNRRLAPSRRNCLGAMRWLVKDCAAGDLLFFHYSGHGGQKRNLKGTELTGFDETIMPIDYKTAGHITDDELNDVLVQSLPAGVRLICVMDCCHSGSGLDLPFYWPIDSNFKAKLRKGAQVWTRELYPKLSDANVILISSCQDTETAADLLIPGWGAGGAVTLGLVTTITNASNPHQVSFYELAKTLRKFLSDRKFTQSPQISTTQPFNPLHHTFNFS